MPLLSACASGSTLRSDYDYQADFSKYHSFGFMSPLDTDKAGYSNLLTERLKSTTCEQMEIRGYVYQAEQLDLLVNFNAKLREQTQVVPAPPLPGIPPGAYYGYRGGFYGGWLGYGWGDEVYEYTQVTLLNVDLIDWCHKQLVWEGVLVGEVSNSAAAQSDAKIRHAVELIFSKYPFRASGASAPGKTQ